MATTHAPPEGRTRATARVGAAASDVAPLTLRARRLPGQVRGLRVGQFVTVELAAVAVLFSIGRPVWVLSAVGAATAVVLGVTFGRRNGRWWHETFGVRRRLRGRRAARRAYTDEDFRLAALRELVPALALHTVAERRNEIGVAQDGVGWFAAIEVAPERGVRGEAHPPVPLDALAELLVDGGVPISAVQVVIHTTPAPSAAISPDAPALMSYRTLAEDGSGGPVPAEQTTWVVARLDAQDAAEATRSRGGGVEGVRRTLAASLGRIGTVLAEAALPYRLLDAEGLLAALSRSCRIADRATATVAGKPRTDERWRAWQADGLAHACFWIQSWPVLRQDTPVLNALARFAAEATSVSVVLAPRPRGVEVRTFVRLAAETDTLERSADALRAAAAQVKVRLRRLDGEHGPAVYASAPTGGGPDE